MIKSKIKFIKDGFTLLSVKLLQSYKAKNINAVSVHNNRRGICNIFLTMIMFDTDEIGKEEILNNG
jgi:hypothetical protein